MEAASPARFRPTRRQALARGLYRGALISLPALTVAMVVDHPVWLWPVLVLAPPVAGMAGEVLLGRRLGTEIDARGIRTASGPVEPWSRVVDVRAERRGARTVVSVYLDSGASVQLPAPYSGEFFAADPRFELKLGTLWHLWRSHRFGGVPG